MKTKEVAKQQAETKVTPKPKKRVITPKKALAKFRETVTEAELTLKGNKVVTSIEKDAMNSLKAVSKLVAKGIDTEGKYSPLGHMASRQNGQLDIALLTIKKGSFLEWVEAVLVNCKSRNTKPSDVKGVVKRLQSHMKFISGRKPSGERNFPNRLAKVGLEKKADEIMTMFAPVSVLFDEYVNASKF